MAKNKHYRVVWEIDVWASTPRKAAEEALKMQRDPKGTATVFDVFVGGPKCPRRIDLAELPRKKKGGFGCLRKTSSATATGA